MNKISLMLFAVSSVIVSCLPCRAQKAPPELVKFEIKKTVPSDVLAQMPQGATSLRFGTLKIGPNNTDVLLHIYSVDSRSTSYSYLGNLQRTSVIDFYFSMFQRVRRGHRSILRRLQSVRTNAIETINGTWLDAKRRRYPVIWMSKGGGGFGGTESLFVFNKGLDHGPVAESYSWTHNIGHFDSSVSLYTDERGVLMIKLWFREGSTEMTSSDVIGNMDLYWNGQRFEPRATEAEPQNK